MVGTAAFVNGIPTETIRSRPKAERKNSPSGMIND